MCQSNLHWCIATALALLLITTFSQARRLMEIDGIEFRGTAKGAHAAPVAQPAETPAEPTTEEPAQAQAAEPPLAQASGLPAGIGAGETCAGKSKGSACWLELDNPSGCYVDPFTC